jgi:hypothetical protein
MTVEASRGTDVAVQRAAAMVCAASSVMSDEAPSASTAREFLSILSMFMAGSFNADKVVGPVIKDAVQKAAASGRFREAVMGAAGWSKDGRSMRATRHVQKHSATSTAFLRR